MAPASKPIVRSVVALMALAVGAPAFTAEMNYSKELTQLSSKVVTTEIEVGEVRQDIIERRGFIGAAEASARFENAVYYYLVEEYDRAAKEFFTLVESRSLKDDNLRHDSEWYLAESLFEMGNVVLAEEAFQSIISKGNSHPFFASAVRRLMEVYSLTGDADGFYTLYNQYIVPGRVKPSAVVQYSLAKSFFRQGEVQKARDLLLSIEEDTGYYGKARYVLGTIYVTQDDFPAAIEQFKLAADISVSGPEEKEVADLAAMALGRLYQEDNDYVNSALYYQRINRESKYFADALYEVSWTFIKDSDYQQALQAVEIFLLAYPEHRHAPQLKLLQGKLHMKEIQYESALSSFETVIESYSDLQAALTEMGSSSDSAARWLKGLIELDVSPNEFSDSTGISTYEQNSEELTTPSGEVIPAFAVEMLVSQADMSRAFTVSRELNRQRNEIESSKELIDQLQYALTESGDSLGVFETARMQLDRYESESFRMLGDLLRIEEAWLLNHAEGANQSELQSLSEQRTQLDRVLNELKTNALDRDERMERYDEQVREVQQRAADLENQIDELETSSAALEERMSRDDVELAEDEEAQIRAQLVQIEVEVEAGRAELKRLQSEKTRLEVTAPVRKRKDAAQRSSEADQLMADLNALKRRFDGYWTRVEADSDRDKVSGEVQTLWGRLAGVQTSISEVRKKMESGERAELASVRSRLATETRSVTESNVELLSHEVSNDRLSSEVAQVSFQHLADEFSQTLLQADVGIVDVYWLRKVTVTDDREGVQRDREALLRELNDRFRIIRQGLED